MGNLERCFWKIFEAVCCTSLTLRFGKSDYRLVPESIMKINKKPIAINPRTKKPFVQVDGNEGIRIDTGSEAMFMVISKTGKRIQLRAFDFVGVPNDSEKPACGRLVDMNHWERIHFLHPKREEEVPFLPGVKGVWKPRANFS